MQDGHNKKEPILEDRRLMTHPARTLDPPFQIVEQAQELEKAEESIQSHVHGKLDLILKQIRALKAEARDIIEQAREDVELHKIKCNFEKRVGQTLHLYERASGDRYFSLLSLADWGGSPPARFIAAYEMKADRSFVRLDPEATSNPDE